VDALLRICRATCAPAELAGCVPASVPSARSAPMAYRNIINCWAVGPSASRGFCLRVKFTLTTKTTQPTITAQLTHARHDAFASVGGSGGGRFDAGWGAGVRLIGDRSYASADDSQQESL